MLRLSANRTWSAAAVLLFSSSLIWCTSLADTQPANNDPTYRALRDAGVAETRFVENVVLERDVAKITLQSGEISFLTPVDGRRWMAVFTGSGRIALKPATEAEAARMRALSGAAELDEEFDSMLLAFSDETYAEIVKQSKETAASQKNIGALAHYRGQLRDRNESARSMVESMINGGSFNIDATLLADAYAPAHRGRFWAAIHGRKHSRLYFSLFPDGALSELGPEEVALLNMEPNGDADGIWYLAHTRAEIDAKTASSSENKLALVARHYTMDVRVERSGHLAATAEIELEPLRDGDRVVAFDLLPNLRVSRVQSDTGAALDFVQESRKQDSAFAVVLKEPAVKGQRFKMKVTYAGDKVIADEGSGNFSVGARESWYPSLGSFRSWATYDITFHAPKQYTVVSVGKRVSETKSDGEAVSVWHSDQPMPVAGFNYGDYRRRERNDPRLHCEMEAYATAEPPGYLRDNSGLMDQTRSPSRGRMSSVGEVTLTPSSMADRVLVDASNSVLIYNAWFGETPFGRVAITQQPQFNFGQSWPTLVYLPISAFLDPTTRWRLLGSNTFRYSKEFIDTVTAHEVAHQWWGHTVGWASYHDQWLSEGFASFSASLFVAATQPKTDEWQKFWDVERRSIVEKNQYGFRGNDAGPIWMGLRLNSAKAPSGYQRVVYSKGAWVLQMLRAMMSDKDTGDKEFIAMMRDFTSSYTAKSASTEDFQRVVERHMRPWMDVEGNKRMDWFFREWVYGTELPNYKFTYSLTDNADGTTLATMKITQSDVGEKFAMPVAVYGDFDGRLIKFGSMALRGNSTTPEIKLNLPKRPRRLLINGANDLLAGSITQN